MIKNILFYSLVTLLLLVTYSNYSYGLDFGDQIVFPSPIDDNCKTDLEKTKAKLCLEYHPDSWWCIYEYCVRYDRVKPQYHYILLPPL